MESLFSMHQFGRGLFLLFDWMFLFHSRCWLYQICIIFWNYRLIRVVAFLRIFWSTNIVYFGLLMITIFCYLEIVIWMIGCCCYSNLWQYCQNVFYWLVFKIEGWYIINENNSGFHTGFFLESQFIFFKNSVQKCLFHTLVDNYNLFRTIFSLSLILFIVFFCHHWFFYCSRRYLFKCRDYFY